MRDRGDVLVALDAQALAVHALLEAVLDDMQRAHLPVRARHAEALVAVTRQADFVRHLFRGLRNRRSRCAGETQHAVEDQRARGRARKFSAADFVHLHPVRVVARDPDQRLSRGWLA